VTRVLLILLVVLAVGGMAFVMLSGGGPEEVGPAAPEPGEREPGRERDGGSERESDPDDPPAIRDEPEPEIPAYPWVEPAWRTAMREALARERVTLEVKDGTFEEVLRALTGQLVWQIDVTDLPAEVHSRAYTINFHEADASRVFQAVASVTQATFHLRPTGIQILPIGLEPKWGRDEIYLAGLASAKRILDAGGPRAAPVEKLLPVEFDKVTLEAALREIANRLHFDIALDPRLTHEQRVTRVTLRTDRMTGALVLDDVTAAARLTWAAEERRILVTFEEDARAIREERQRAKVNSAMSTSVAFGDRMLADVAKEIGEQAGVPVVVDLALWVPNHPRITLRAGPAPLGRVLRALAPKIPARFLIRGEAIYLIPPKGR